MFKPVRKNDDDDRLETSFHVIREFADVLRQKGSIYESETFLGKSCEISERIDDGKSRAIDIEEVVYKLGSSALYKHDLDCAIRFFRQCLPLITKSGFKNDENRNFALTGLRIAFCLLRKGQI